MVLYFSGPQFSGPHFSGSHFSGPLLQLLYSAESWKNGNKIDPDIREFVLSHGQKKKIRIASRANVARAII